MHTVLREMKIETYFIFLVLNNALYYCYLIENKYCVTIIYINLFLALGKDPSALMAATKKSFPAKYGRCKETNDVTKPCTCRFQICVGWYPCGLKYCRGKDSSGKYVSYRCGIKTCKRHLSFDHVAKQKLYCLWDDL